MMKLCTVPGCEAPASGCCDSCGAPRCDEHSVSGVFYGTDTVACRVEMPAHPSGTPVSLCEEGSRERRS